MKVVTIPTKGLAKPALLYPDLKSIRPPNSIRKIALPTIDGICFEKVQDIAYLKAEGNYTLLHFIDGRQILVCKTLLHMEELINSPLQFVRIHRSNTINLNWLQKYVKGKGGYVVMENGLNITVSIGRKPAFLNALERYF